ncbi:hypothetical protein SAMN04488107_0084 [Geodermatophilus saharensis]|uniref:Uncharacterized protein n=1 Tax=Geodermatophilus saharensis TaxID=1137994 RepID=A0A238ZHS0_9ACTN|nr:hypothetical protein [Geodermatophilus saharensis]SNR82692.1 hypothetical protein SAMN04488107_0084 [Geodermatophilus saharensis]
MDTVVLRSSEIRLDGEARLGWWLVSEDGFGPGRLVDGPFPDRAGAAWAAAGHAVDEGASLRPVYGLRRPDGGLHRRPSPQEMAWLAHLGDQLDRLPEDWDAALADDDPLATLVVEVAAALTEAGLPLWDATGSGTALGGACVSAEPGLDGVVVGWRQHDRMSVEQVHGLVADISIQAVMNRALADVLWLRGLEVTPLGGDAGGSVVRYAD